MGACVSASTKVIYPANDEAVGLFQGRPAHVDEKGGFIVSVDGEWRPVREHDWPDVIRFTDVDVTTMRKEVYAHRHEATTLFSPDSFLACVVGRIRPGSASALFQDDSTFIRRGPFLYQVVRRGTGVCPATGDTVRYSKKRFRDGFPGDIVRLPVRARI